MTSVTDELMSCVGESERKRRERERKIYKREESERESGEMRGE